MTRVVWEKNGSRLIHGDCREVMPTLEKVDHVITDPPYEAEAHTKQRRVKRAENEPLSFEPMDEETRLFCAAEFFRLAARWSVVFCQVEAVNVWSRNLVEAGCNTKRIGVWVKPDAMPQYSGDRPGMGYESLLFAHAPGRSSWNGGGRVGVFTYNKNTPGGAHEHETQKPVPLMLELISLFTDPGELVLDPFAGSGTTGVACLRLGRRFIGIERDEKYAAIAAERLEAESNGLTLRDARAGQLPMFGGGAA